MIPLRITIKNFLCHEEQTFDFEGHPIWLLHGPNGVGKSAVFDAILYALYGSHRRRDSDDGKVVGLIRKGQTALRVDFDFESAGKRYRIWRTRPRSGKTRQGVSELVDGEPVPIAIADNQNDVDQWMLATLGLSEEAFVSAVLLRQGAAERLIDAGSDARRDLFRGIIDLEPFIRLHDSVYEDRRRKSSDRDALKRLVNDAPRVEEAEVAAAAESQQVAAESLDRQRASEAASRDSLEQARRWDEFDLDLRAIQSELQSADSRLKQREQIERDAARLAELQEVLPRLEQLKAARQEYDRLVGREADRQEKLQTLRDRQRALSESVVQCGTARQHFGEQAESLQRAIVVLDNDLKSLKDEIDRADRAKELYSQLEQDEQEWQNVSPSLDADRREAEAAVQAAQAAKDLLPHRRTLIAQRAAYQRAEQESELARQAASDAAARILTTTAEKTQSLEAETAAHQALTEARQHAAVIRSRIADLQAKQQRFQTAANDHVCSLCGREIDETHAEKERQSLAEQLQVAAAEQEGLTLADTALKHAHTEAVQQRMQSEASLRALESEASDASRRTTAADQQRVASRAAFQTAVAELGDASVPAIETADAAEANALTTATSTAAALTSQNAKLKDLLHRTQRRESLSNSIATLKRAVGAIDKPVDVAALRERQAALVGQRGTQAEAFRIARTRQADAEREETATAAKARTLARELATATSLHHEAAIAAALALHKRDAALDALPAASRGEVDLAALAAECRTLQAAKVDELAQALEQDRRTHQQREDRHRELLAKIDEIPLPSRRSPQDVDRDWKSAQAAVKTAETEFARAKSLVETLHARRERRTKLEADLLQVEGEHTLHDNLVNHLGETGVQQWLTAEASRRIVEVAGESLEQISSGDLQFEPPEADGFDLRIRRRGCSEPIPVGSLSGGQRCRVAVALALAVCRFAAGESRPLESLIIDEAFANLDSEGRRAMIDLLRSGTLANGLLKRIIVVSHHDDVLASFENRYRFENDSGRTVVTRA